MNIEKFKSLAENNLIDSIIVKNNQTIIGGGWFKVAIKIAGGVVGWILTSSEELNPQGPYSGEIGDCTCNTEGCK